MFKLSILLSIGCLTGAAIADCRMQGGAIDPNNQTQAAPFSDPNTAIGLGLCKPQGPGSWTFGFRVSMVDVPAPGQSGEPGANTADTWYIFDEYCKVRSSYIEPPCGIPASIEEDFLPYVLSLKAVDLGVADPYFKFDYANGEYSIGTNGCGCDKSHSQGLEAITYCKCAFPIHGEPKRRGVAFEA